MSFEIMKSASASWDPYFGNWLHESVDSDGSFVSIEIFFSTNDNDGMKNARLKWLLSCIWRASLS